MRYATLSALFVALSLAQSATAQQQTIVVADQPPVIAEVPMVPVVTSPAPTVVLRPVTTAPTTVYYGTPVAGTVTTYRPLVSSYGTARVVYSPVTAAPTMIVQPATHTVFAMPTQLVGQTVYSPVPVTVMRPAVPVPTGYVVGRGLIGQPKVYVPGQPMRNALRFVSP